MKGSEIATLGHVAERNNTEIDKLDGEIYEKEMDVESTIEEEMRLKNENGKNNQVMVSS